jgi:carboxypeptidase C (cathepsin A)
MTDRHRKILAAGVLTLLWSGPGVAEESEAKSATIEEREPIVTRHRVALEGRELDYTVTTGMLPIRNDEEETEAEIFFMAYVAEGMPHPAERPLLFSFNGGPGSSSVWLHLGALGPKRVRMRDDGAMPAPPYALVDNPGTWLDLMDIVFIDPVGTGYSRATTAALGEKFWGLEGDIESVGEFIRLYLTRHERWASPLFLVGESYGTTRAAGLAGHLIDRGVAFNGIILVSSILNFQTARFVAGNDLPFVLFLPTYTATAWFHGRLDEDLSRDLRSTLEAAERWAASDYRLALAAGSGLQGRERSAAVKQLARFTGLSEAYVDNADLRVPIYRFVKELLRDEKRTVGRLDSRFQGADRDASGERYEFDPSLAAIRPPYTATFNNYVRTQLGYETDRVYHILGGGIGAWDFGAARDGFPDTSESLRSAMAKNPAMKVFVASGYYDLATPFFATRYTLDHMSLGPSDRERIFTGDYEAGHMMYIDVDELMNLKRDVAAFVAEALRGE